VGYDHLTPVHVQIPPPPIGGSNANVGFKDNALYLVNGGYKFDSGMRVELELSFDEHSLHNYGCRDSNAALNCVGGGESTTSALVNFVYDWQLGDGWGLSLGGGVGAADVNAYIKGNPGKVDIASGAHTEFEWQGIVGAYWALTDNLDLTIDYRYRSAEVDHDYDCDVCNGAGPDQPGAIHVFEAREHVGLVGIRYYLGSAPPPPPPPPPPRPKPPAVALTLNDSPASL
jgi:opacity protein-like surface antigen